MLAGSVKRRRANYNPLTNRMPLLRAEQIVPSGHVRVGLHQLTHSAVKATANAARAAIVRRHGHARNRLLGRLGAWAHVADDYRAVRAPIVVQTDARSGYAG